MVLKEHEKQGPIARQNQPVAAEFEGEEKANSDRQRCKCCWSFFLIVNLLNCAIYFVLKSLFREMDVTAKLWGSSCIDDIKKYSMIPLEAPL